MLELLFELYDEATKVCNPNMCRVAEVHACKWCKHDIQGIFVPTIMEAVWRVKYQQLNK